MDAKKKLGIIICTFFSIEVLASAYVFIINAFGLYNETVSVIFWSILNATRLGIFFYVFCQTNVFSNRCGRYAALALCISNVIYLINNITASSMNINVYDWIGSYGSVFISIVYIAFVLLFFWLSKSWVAINVCATVASVFSLIQSFGWPQVKRLYDLYNETHDYEILDKASSISASYDNFTNLATLFYFAGLVCTIIWLNKRQKTPSVQSNPIDLI